MENTSYIALSRQTTLWRQMENIANNLANMNTSGYRGEEALFTDYLVRTPNTESAFRDQVRFVQDFGTVNDTTPAPIRETGNQMDLALESQDTYFVVETAAGQRYTRAGRFNLNDQGQLVTSEGKTVLSDADAPIFIAPNESRFEVSHDGTVRTENGPVGKLKIARFDDPQRLRREGSGLWTPSAGQTPQTADNPRVVQSMLEGSNVNGVTEMTRMIDVQRSYQHTQNLINQEDDRIKRAMEAWSRRV